MPSSLKYLFLFCPLFFVAGQYAGGALFFKITDISLGFLQFSSLYDNWKEYGQVASFRPFLQLSIAASILVSLFPLIMAVVVFFALNTSEKIHGDAKWATERDLKKSGFFPTPEQRTSPAILLGKMSKGKYKDRYVELQGQTFVGLSAPTGSGKGVSVVIPNLLNYSDSVVVTDIKLENFFKTAGFRQSQGQEVFLFAPDGYAVNEADREAGMLRSHCWNPFFYIRRNPAYVMNDIGVMATSIYPLSGDGKSDIWPSQAGALFTALTLWMIDTEAKTGQVPTFPYLLTIVGIEGGLDKWIKSELNKASCADADGEYLSANCMMGLNEYVSLPDDTKGGVFMNFKDALEIYKDKTVAAAVSRNDFDFTELRKRGISLYVGVQPPNLARFGKVLNLFFEQLISINTRVIPELDSSLKYQCLCILDEFPALGRINQIKKSIGYTRQYDLRYLIIYQDFAQLEDRELYGKEGARNIVGNVATEIIFPPKTVNQRVKEISETIGTKTVKQPIHSISVGSKVTKSKNYSLQKRALIMPQEIVELGHTRHPTVDISTKAMLFKENQRSFIMDKIIYFEEPIFAARCDVSKNNIPEIPLLKI